MACGLLWGQPYKTKFWEETKMKKFLSLCMAGVMAASLLTGCGGDAAKDDTPAANGAPSEGGVQYTKHTLAASIPLTGNTMQYGISYKNALEMAVADFNAAGGLGGEDVVLEINDDKGDQKEGINIANKIVGEKDVFATVGSFGSSVTMAAAPVYEKNSMPLVSPNTSHPDFPEMGKMMIPISPIADLERTKTTNLLFEKFGGGDLAIIHQNTDLGVAGAEIMKKTYEDLGGKVVLIENFVPQQTKDFTPILSKAKAANPAILYIDGEYNDVANAILQTEKVGLTGVQLAGPGNVFKQEFLDLVGNKADGIILAGTTPVYLDSIMNGENDYSEYLKDFTKRYTEKYPDVPCDGFAASAYDAAMLAMTAAKNVGTTDPQALIDEMHKAPIEVASGKSMSFDGQYVVKDVFIYTVKDGEFASYNA